MRRFLSQLRPPLARVGKNSQVFRSENHTASCFAELQITEDYQKSKGKAWLSLSLESTFLVAKHDKICRQTHS